MKILIIRFNKEKYKDEIDLLIILINSFHRIIQK